MLIMLMVVVFILSIGLLIAAPLWQTEIRRDMEDELIFRGKQYVEAVRLFTLKYPGRFPSTLEELLEEKCIRKLYEDPMVESGEWNVILSTGRAAGSQGRAVQEVLVAPQNALSGIQNARILGVVSSSTERSIKIYYEQESYDTWLFYYGQDPQKLPKIRYYGEEETIP